MNISPHHYMEILARREKAAGTSETDFINMFAQTYKTIARKIYRDVPEAGVQRKESR